MLKILLLAIIGFVLSLEKLSVYSGVDCRKENERAYILQSFDGCLRIKDFDESDLVTLTDLYNGTLIYSTKCNTGCSKCTNTKIGTARTTARSTSSDINCYNFPDNTSMSISEWKAYDYLYVYFYQGSLCTDFNYGFAYPLDVCVKHYGRYEKYICDNNVPMVYYCTSCNSECEVEIHNPACNDISNTRFMCSRFSLGSRNFISYLNLLVIFLIVLSTQY
jgi:hypothetical protein